jgi:hypothetical protein
MRRLGDRSGLRGDLSSKREMNLPSHVILLPEFLIFTQVLQVWRVEIMRLRLLIVHYHRVQKLMSKTIRIGVNVR